MMNNERTPQGIPPQSFAALPAGWGALNWLQLVTIWTIFHEVHGDPARYHFAVFCYLMGLPPLERWTKDGDMLSVKTRRHHLTISISDLEFYAHGQLAWLDDPYTLPVLPKEYVKVGRSSYKLPEANLLNYTWQQYNNVQRIMTALWKVETRLSKLLKTPIPSEQSAADVTVKATMVEVNKAEEDILDLRAQFLAHALLPSAFALTETKDRTTRLRPHMVYQYDVEVARGHTAAMRKAKPWLFNIVYQCVQSSLSFYSRQFPELFRSSGAGHQRRNELTAEVGTVNAVMKYNGYRDQQDVYDSNAVFVFQILSTMVKESEEMKKITKKK